MLVASDPFIWSAFDESGEIIDEKYNTAVLSRNKSPLYASLNWLSETGVIDENDLLSFERIKTARNSLAHQFAFVGYGWC
ncbi:MAG: hypothetical protein WDM70_10100 [Nitrosomonadales bacterium]